MLYQLTAGLLALLTLSWSVWRAAGHTPAGAFRGHARSDQPATPAGERLAMAVVATGALCVLVALAQSVVPVTTGMRVVRVVDRAPGLAVLELRGQKVRDCRRIDTTASVIGPDGEPVKATIDWPGDRAPGSSRPTGWQSFGVWSITWDAAAEPARQIVIDTQHQCHPWWPVTRTRVVLGVTVVK